MNPPYWIVLSDENHKRSWFDVDVTTSGGRRKLQYCPPVHCVNKWKVLFNGKFLYYANFFYIVNNEKRNKAIRYYISRLVSSIGPFSRVVYLNICEFLYMIEQNLDHHFPLLFFCIYRTTQLFDFLHSFLVCTHCYAFQVTKADW